MTKSSHCSVCKRALSDQPQPDGSQRATFIEATPLRLGRGLHEEACLCERCDAQLGYSLTEVLRRAMAQRAEGKP
jgi:hypothetical protein